MKKIFALLLCLSMLLSLCTVAFAADRTGKKEYQVYTCLGDSVAAGAAQPKEVTNIFGYDAEDLPAYLAALYDENSTLIYRGYKPEPVPTAYHSLVADALDAKLNQCARSGMRAIELRYMLTGVYTDPDTTYSYGNNYFDYDKNGFTLSDLDYVNNLYHFSDKIAEADIITLAIGSNDVLAPTLGVLAALMNDNSSDPELTAFIQELESRGTIGSFEAALVSLSQSTSKYAAAIKNMLDNFKQSLALFSTNYCAIVDKIYELNPDVTLLCVGAFNPFNDTRLTANSTLDLSFVVKPFVDALNTYFRSLSLKYGSSFIYVDVTNTPLYDQVIKDPLYMNYLTLKLHPTTAGHQYMANKILDRVPGYITEASCRRAALRTVCTAIIAAHIIHMAVQK